jgi:hypothetical protein
MNLAKQIYNQIYSRWQQSNRLGLEQDRRERMWPSASPDTVEGQRQSVSPLGGVAKESENGK